MKQRLLGGAIGAVALGGCWYLFGLLLGRPVVPTEVLIGMVLYFGIWLVFPRSTRRRK